MDGVVATADHGSKCYSGGWVILGAGGHASSVSDVLRSSGQVVLAVSGEATIRWDVVVLPSDKSALDMAVDRDAYIALGIGDNAVRLALTRSLPRQFLRPAVSVMSTCSDRAEIGLGVSVLHHAHVGPGVRLGDAVIVNTAAIVEHDSVVGDGAHVAPGACLLGGSTVGRRTLVGSGARILPGVSVGDNVTVGAGAVVVDDVPSGTTVTGVPARPVT